MQAPVDDTTWVREIGIFSGVWDRKVLRKTYMCSPIAEPHAHCGGNVTIQKGTSHTVGGQIEFELVDGVSISGGYSYSWSNGQETSVAAPPCNCCYATACDNFTITSWRVTSNWSGNVRTEVTVVKDGGADAYGTPSCEFNPDCPNCSDAGVTVADAGVSGPITGVDTRRDAGSDAELPQHSGDDRSDQGRDGSEQRDSDIGGAQAQLVAPQPVASITIELEPLLAANGRVRGAVFGSTLAGTNAVAREALMKLAEEGAQIAGAPRGAVFVREVSGAIVRMR